MKKFTVLIVLVSVLLVMSSSCFAMTQKEIQGIREEYQNIIDSAPSVSYSELCNNPSYKGRSVAFTAVFEETSINTGSAMFRDYNGNVFVIASPLPYRFKPGTSYTVSATFFKIVVANDGEPAAVFTYEQAHLPILSEYGL